MTAQEAFRKMLKEEVGPALRRLGFKGSGQRYELPSETHWAIVGFQKFTRSDRDRVEFTVNVTVTDRNEWERESKARPYIGPRPSANVGANVGWEKRIADIVPGNGGDVIWTVIAGQTTEPVAGDVVSTLADYVIPAIRRRIAREQRR